jgi:hypothetical protein
LSDKEVDGMLIALEKASNSQIRRIQGLLTDIQRDRCVAEGDEAALIEEGFIRGFDGRGHALSPWVIGDVLVCPGSIVYKSATSHECFFVKIEDEWVWESSEAFADVVRRIGEGARQHQRSVTLVSALEGMSLDYVHAKKRQGAHRGISGSSYRITGGSLEHISTRTTKVGEHR